MTAPNMHLSYWDTGSSAYTHLLETKNKVREGGLPDVLLELVFLRASQLNGCSFCVARHSAAARNAGASAEQIEALADWRAASVFSVREKAALEWTEAVTRLGDALLVATAEQLLLDVFTPRQIVDLTIAIGLINALNRLAIALGRNG